MDVLVWYYEGKVEEKATTTQQSIAVISNGENHDCLNDVKYQRKKCKLHW